ncbi:LacI family regulatory protein (plasmid) [Ketogulonicigenium robustum]|uniref:LacI family regulatory protein n=1 Tax=Ketogulonicigenium robustum TaxID=92947 RepID=A0A1W6P3F5_9RHOB|nr:LacI family regulatory protein [Ketogulonicigenium robustum]
MDRVLNERGSVSEKTREKVLTAARALGINRALPEAWHRVQHVGIILPRSRSQHWQLLDDAFIGFSHALPRWMILHRQRVAQNDLKALREAVIAPGFQRGGLIIAPDAADEIAPALREIMARGEQLITLTNNVLNLPDHPYSGIDHAMAGRTIGYLMRRLTPGGGRVVILQCNNRRLEHFERVSGFQKAFGDDGSLTVQHVDEENPGAAEGAIRKLLATGERIAGLYVTGNVSAELAPLIAAMGPARPVWITHERLPLHCDLLRAGVLDFVLDQDAAAQAAWALSEMVRALSGECWAGGQVQAPELRLYCRENLP